MNLKANGQLVLKKQAVSTADPIMWLNDTGQTTNKFILFAQDGNEKASIGLAGNDLRFARDGYNETLRIDSSGNITQGIAGSATFAAINSISANAARGIEIFKDGTDTGSAIKLAGDNGSGNKAYSQLGYSGANATAHWATYNTAGNKVGEIQIGSTGNIGIGDRTSNPDEDLHVHTASGQANIHVEGATDGQIILRAHSGDSVIHFGDAAATSVGKINYDHGTDSLAFNTNSNERLRILSSGEMGLGTATPPTGTFTIHLTETPELNLYSTQHAPVSYTHLTLPTNREV